MRILFISDVHLSEADAATTARFAHFMRTVAPGADQLYILGDLFHVWLGDAAIKRSNFLQQAQTLFERLHRGKTQIFFIHGNRDFLISAPFEWAFHCKILPPQMVIQLGTQRALLLHGDELCTDDHAYQRARKMLRSRAFKWFANAIPISWRERIAHALRRASKSHQHNAPMSILDVNRDAVAAAFDAHDVALMIHGHTHRPTDEIIATSNGPKRRIVLSDWQQDYGYLEWIDGEFFVRRFPSDG